MVVNGWTLSTVSKLMEFEEDESRERASLDRMIFSSPGTSMVLTKSDFKKRE